MKRGWDSGLLLREVCEEVLEVAGVEEVDAEDLVEGRLEDEEVVEGVEWFNRRDIAAGRAASSSVPFVSLSSDSRPFVVSSLAYSFHSCSIC